MYFESFMESLTESEIISNRESIKMQSIHPYEIMSDKENVLQEAIFAKENIQMVFNKAKEVFINLTKKMVKISQDLAAKNREKLKSMAQTVVDNSKLRDFKFEMFDYQEGIKRIENTPLPKLESVNLQDLSGNSEVFKEHAFKNVYVTDNDGNEDISKSYFRGSPEKIIIDESKAKDLWMYAVSYCIKYDNFAKNIESQNIMLNRTIDTALGNTKTVVTESTLLSESVFKDEYYDILLEDIVGPDDLEKQEDNKNNDIKSNPGENKQNKQSSDDQENIKKYWKICSTIQTMKMDVAREAYIAFGDFLDKAAKYSSEQRNRNGKNND